jgi:predicted RNA binding protein YcfA (HicA-like mRNA interferase family)
MTHLTVVSGRVCVAALERAGFTIRRQVGSHIVMRRNEPFAQTVVPNHRVWTAAHSEPSFARRA